MSSFVFETRMWNRYNYSLFVVMIKQISNKIFNYFIQKLIKWFIRFWGFLFHENYSINQATNKSKISVMENKRLSTIASLTIIIKRCERFFNGCRTCFLYIFLLLLRISSNVLRLFPFKRKAAGSLFWKFPKRSKSEKCQRLVSFCAPCSSPCVLVNISWISFELFVRKKMFLY